MKIYTKTGDSGETSLFGGKRVKKYDLRIESYGTIDELNSHIGLLRDQKIDKHTYHTLIKIQNELFSIGAMLATPPEKEKLKSGRNRLQSTIISKDEISFLEKEIDKMESTLKPMTNFILPGGHSSVSICHIARCICRRAERITVQLNEEQSVNKDILTYINRLSDYLFVLARKLSMVNKAHEIPWISSKQD
jgi:cob(I)alamin adenosyltransferase